MDCCYVGILRSGALSLGVVRFDQRHPELEPAETAGSFTKWWETTGSEIQQPRQKTNKGCSHYAKRVYSGALLSTRQKWQVGDLHSPKEYQPAVKLDCVPA